MSVKTNANLDSYTVYRIKQNEQFYDCQYGYIYAVPDANVYLHQCKKHKDLVCDTNCKCSDFCKKVRS